MNYFPVEYVDFNTSNEIIQAQGHVAGEEEEDDAGRERLSQRSSAFLSHTLPNLAVIHGPSSCGKTSLAFQYAVSAACRGESVLFCINQKGLQTKIPKPQVPLHHVSDDVLSLIEFVYVESYDGACQALSTIGTENSCCDRIPNHIIVEESELAPSLDPRAVTATLACLANTVASVRTLTKSSASSSHGCCGVFVSAHAYAFPFDHFSVFPFAVCPTWTSLMISSDPSGVVGQNGGVYDVKICAVERGLEGSVGFTMRYTFSVEAMVVLSPLSLSNP